MYNRKILTKLNSQVFKMSFKNINCYFNNILHILQTLNDCKCNNY